MKFILKIPLGLLMMASACNNREPGKTNADKSYFDLKGYFTAEASKLQQQNPLISKTVVLNGSQEEKKLQIADWSKELSIFIDADINKPAWKGEFTHTVTDSLESYTTKSEKIPVRKVNLHKSGNTIDEINIILHTNNSLYDSADTLVYKPGELYQISKSQKIRLMDQKNYLMRGLFPQK
ncbi:hypothetical protein N180_20700 [Pedobacter antarcticus 4BY]|uniref:Uncharacterized protein n=2 Tax=Pedobacter antarcticus TaxID=34086 RepID=A0A081PEW0_9SPHI|nr:hypothetical protein [Pedobacter antarcticus]KEQ29233.1 hypothetical protein N180_20700 [Pedobacter antarcticus 4BY]SFE95534.1 hypothetical protein SAMN03003324_01968 [Pedobacter antarcticus]